MTANKDLFLAILAMDSYNRGYGQGISGLSESGSIGNATISRRSEIFGSSTDPVFQSWQAAGFYAIAYDVSQMKDAKGDPLFGTDGTVIAYRGTDGILAGDLLYGWTLGGGGVDFRPAMLVANHRAVAANDNQPDAGLERAFRSGSNDDRQCRKFLLTPWT
jgi:hypothetical protein